MQNPKSTIKIVGIGDSITYGYPYTPAQSWLNQAATKLDIDFVNSGENGDTTDGMIIRFKRDVVSHRPTHVIIMGGTNDAYWGRPADQVLANIREMSEMAIEQGIRPIIGLPIPCNDDPEMTLLSAYRDGMRCYAAEAELAVIDFYSAMVNASDGQIRRGSHLDGVHPNQAGYKIMTETAVTAFARILFAASGTNM